MAFVVALRAAAISLVSNGQHSADFRRPRLDFHRAKGKVLRAV